ncbi:hypothetical protein MKX01_008437, partial [Papaver californicum]
MNTEDNEEEGLQLLQQLQESVDSDPTNASHHYNLAHQKKWTEAVQSLQHAIRGYPTCADLWETLGLSYQRLGKLTAIIK